MVDGEFSHLTNDEVVNLHDTNYKIIMDTLPEDKWGAVHDLLELDREFHRREE